MKPNGFRAAIINYIREQAKPVDKFSHQARLYKLTREIGADQSCDDVVFAAVWLHDLDVFIGHWPVCRAILAGRTGGCHHTRFDIIYRLLRRRARC
ncbi:MAG: hypothetical protein IH623_02805 [Verrucomicrobia bacterium]|nr:hypothetical protein [Verrucomicrobiota bacterium]